MSGLWSGPENFVKQSQEEIYRNDSEESFVIIGSGIAGLSAAEAIRQRNQTAKIIMVTEEEENLLPAYAFRLPGRGPDYR